MRWFLVLLALLAPTPTAWSICDLPPPAIDPPPPGYPPPGDGPITPGPTPTPNPGTGGPDTGGPTTGDPYGRPNVRTRRAAAGYGNAWHLWWELNREHLLGLRQTLKRRDVISGSRSGATVDPVAALRPGVRAALKTIALGATQNVHLRAAALRALGRTGGDDEARLLLGILRNSRERGAVLEGAAVGLGLVPRIGDPKLREEVGKYFQDLLEDKTPLRGCTRLVAIVGLSLRARTTPALAWQLVDRCQRRLSSADEATALLLACAITRHPCALPPLLEAAHTARLGPNRLHDVGRAQAVLGLGLLGDPSAIPAVSKILGSRRTGTHTRRSAALALGHLLRRPDVPAPHRKRAEQALLRGFDKIREPVGRAFCVVALGTAYEPFGLDVLRDTVANKGHTPEGPFAALALGLAADRLPRKEQAATRTFLARELRDAKHANARAALALAVGLAGGKDAQEVLVAVVKKERGRAPVRGPAIQGLGLIGDINPDLEKMLVTTIDDGAHEVVEDSALALGLLGWRRTATLLVDKLRDTKSVPVQVHMVAALSHLGGTVAVEPLIALLANGAKKHTQRASAASALGILAGERDHDPLFEIDAFTNPYALTAATRAVVLVY